MSCFQFEVAMRKAVDALHEASAATKLLRLPADERAAMREALRAVRLRLLDLDQSVAIATLVEAEVEAVLRQVINPQYPLDS